MRITLVLLPLLLHASVALSQPDASIVVKVLNAEDQPLAGARVKLLGTQRGAIANHAGVATVTKLDKGKSYDLEVALVGYSFDTIRNVVAGSPESIKLTSTLKERPAEYIRLPEKSPRYLEGQRKTKNDISTDHFSRDSLARIIVDPGPHPKMHIRGGRATDSLQETK